MTGLINLFNYTTFDILRDYDVNYIQFQAWVLIWSAISHWLIAIFNICDYTRFVTDMTSETFGFCAFALPPPCNLHLHTHARRPSPTDVGVIYVQKGIELLVYEFDDGTGQAGWLSVVIAMLFALCVYFVERAGKLHFGRALVCYPVKG